MTHADRPKVLRHPSTLRRELQEYDPSVARVARPTHRVELLELKHLPADRSEIHRSGGGQPSHGLLPTAEQRPQEHCPLLGDINTRCLGDPRRSLPAGQEAPETLQGSRKLVECVGWEHPPEGTDRLTRLALRGFQLVLFRRLGCRRTVLQRVQGGGATSASETTRSL